MRATTTFGVHRIGRAARVTMTAARLRNRERCAGPMWRPSERWRSGWDGEFESPLLQRRVNKLSVPFALARLPALFCFAGSGCTVLSYEGVYGDRYSSLLQ